MGPMPLSCMPPRRSEYGIVGINEGIISTEIAPFGGAPPLIPSPASRGGEGGGVVGHLDRLGIGLEAVERGGGPECSLLGDAMSVVTSFEYPSAAITSGDRSTRRAAAGSSKVDPWLNRGYRRGAPER
jgi:hypothetical protein